MTFSDAREAGPVTKRLPVVDIELVVINELTVSVLRDKVDNVPVVLEVRTNNVE